VLEYTEFQAWERGPRIGVEDAIKDKRKDVPGDQGTRSFGPANRGVWLLTKGGSRSRQAYISENLFAGVVSFLLTMTV
jgi:hypothetical protein